MAVTEPQHAGDYRCPDDGGGQVGAGQRVNLRRFQLVRTVPARDGGPDIDIVVDFLMPRDAEITRNTPPLISQFAVQRADGAELALRFYQLVAIEGDMPDGGRNLVGSTHWWTQPDRSSTWNRPGKATS